MNAALRTSLTTAVLALSTLSGAHASQSSQAAGFNPHNMSFKTGAYRCELGRSVNVRTVSSDLQTATLSWNKRDYTMRAVDARSGALRYEDKASGLVWLMIPGKSMLLDTRQGQRLADECRA